MMMMKLVVFLSVLGSVTAGSASPELTLSVRDGSFGDMASAITPKVSLGGMELGDSGIQVGGDLDVITGDITDMMNAPKSIWASKTADAPAGWTVKARAEFSQGKYEYPDGRGVYVSVEANDEDETCFGWVSGDVSSAGLAPLKIGGKKVFQAPGGGKLMVEPRLRFYKGTTDEGPDLCLGYERDNTDLYLTVSEKDQNVKIVQSIPDADTKVSAKFGTAGGGFLYAKVENSSTDMGKTTVTVTKQNTILQLEQGGWTAGMKLSYPLHKAEPQVQFRKSFSLPVLGKYQGDPMGGLE